MQQRFVIEIAGGDAGIVVADGRGYRFFAAHKAYNALDRRLFASPAAAQAACRVATAFFAPEPIVLRHANPCDIMVGG